MQRRCLQPGLLGQLLSGALHILQSPATAGCWEAAAQHIRLEGQVQLRNLAMLHLRQPAASEAGTAPAQLPQLRANPRLAIASATTAVAMSAAAARLHRQTLPLRLHQSGSAADRGNRPTLQSPQLTTPQPSGMRSQGLPPPVTVPRPQQPLQRMQQLMPAPQHLRLPARLSGSAPKQQQHRRQWRRSLSPLQGRPRRRSSPRSRPQLQLHQPSSRRCRRPTSQPACHWTPGRGLP